MSCDKPVRQNKWAKPEIVGFINSSANASLLANQPPAEIAFSHRPEKLLLKEMRACR
jgi:hypothetical protein